MIKGIEVFTSLRTPSIIENNMHMFDDTICDEGYDYLAWEVFSDNMINIITSVLRRKIKGEIKFEELFRFNNANNI